MIRTLLVDDDALTIELHRTYLERIDGFVVGGECTGARAALSAVLAQPTDQPFDLVLLDLTSPTVRASTSCVHCAPAARQST